MNPKSKRLIPYEDDNDIKITFRANREMLDFIIKESERNFRGSKSAFIKHCINEHIMRTIDKRRELERARQKQKDEDWYIFFGNHNDFA